VTLTNSAGGRFALVQSNRRDTGTNYQLVVANTNRINSVATPELTVQFRVVSGSFDVFLETSLIVDSPPVVPVFSASSVTRDWPAFSQLALVSLSGLQNSNLIASFSLVGPNSNLFQISSTGALTASVTLAQGLTNYASNSLTVTVHVTFASQSGQLNAIPAVDGNLTLAVHDVHVAPVFDSFNEPVVVSIDVTPGTVLLNVVAHGFGSITYSIANFVPTLAAGFFAVDKNSGAISSVVVPSSSSLTAGAYQLDLTATDGILSTTITAHFEIRDNCYSAPNADPSTVPCLGNGQCVNAFKSYTCICDIAHTGANCDQMDGNFCLHQHRHRLAARVEWDLVRSPASSLEWWLECC